MFLSLKSPVHLLILGALVTVSGLSGCSLEKAPITIGFSGELSGGRRNPSILVYRGVEYAVEAWNKRGGIEGRKIELITLDDGGVPSRAKETAAVLVERKVAAVVGFPTSDTAVAAMDILSDAGLVAITPTASSSELTGRDDSFFTLFAGNEALAKKAADFAKNRLKVSSVNIIYDTDNLDYTKNYADLFSRFFEDTAHRIPGRIPFSTGDEANGSVPYLEVMESALRDKPEGLLVLATSLDTAMFLQQLNKLSPGIPFITSDWASNEEFIRLGGPLTGSSYYADVRLIDDDSAEYPAFRDAFTERYGHAPSIGSILGYEAADIIFRAVRGQDKEHNLKNVLSDGSFPTFSGPLRFNETGDAVRTIVMKTVKGGSFAEID
jgi:branched-chain amino acid transport system substrate-binding protein